MINISQDVHSLAGFKRNTVGLMRRMKKTRRPLVLTVKGKVEAVVMDPVAYQDLTHRRNITESISRGLMQAKRGMGRSVDEVFDDIEREDAVPRS
jgi:PHD/YefM family antitoxin component YafN of YafNO toxin-antitoxin module